MRTPFSSFTHKEITAMATSSSPDNTNGSALAAGLRHITAAAGSGKTTFAWHPAAQQLAQMLHPSLQHERGQLAMAF
ncbi:MAG: hypothetical protein OXE94_10395 [Aestuariivita sp.]|nr:hypothetical protein [Aestuariivita sp.]